MTGRKSLEKQRGSSSGEPAAEQSEPAAKMSRAVTSNGELALVSAPDAVHEAGFMPARTIRSPWWSDPLHGTYYAIGPTNERAAKTDFGAGT